MVGEKVLGALGHLRCHKATDDATRQGEGYCLRSKARIGHVCRRKAVVLAEGRVAAHDHHAETQQPEARQINRQCIQCRATHADGGPHLKTIAAADGFHQHRRRKRGECGTDHVTSERHSGKRRIRRQGKPRQPCNHNQRYATGLQRGLTGGEH